MRKKILCVGETMAMITPAQPGPVATSELFTMSAGGAESNVAGHLASMSFDTSWLGRLGDDALGDRVFAELQARDLDTRWVIRHSSSPTGLYVKDPMPGDRAAVAYYRSTSAASTMSSSDFDLWPFAEARWVHLSGVTPALSASCNALVERILNESVNYDYLVSFDVNYRSALWSVAEARDRCSYIGNRSEVVLVGLDEAAILWGTTTAEQVADIFPHARYVVVKDGAVEAVELALHPDGGRSVVRVPALPVEVVEAVGAGDAFAAGYLGGMLRGLDPVSRLAAGHELAAWTLGSSADYRPRAGYRAGERRG